MKVRIGMPQMAVRGLSENWLLKFCGDRHWNEIAALYGLQSHELVDDQENRIYPSFVAIRARYVRPVAAIGENDEIEFSTEVDRFGPAVVRTQHRGSIGGQQALSIEMVTKFVARTRGDGNDLRGASLRPHPVGIAKELDVPSALMRDFQMVRAEQGYDIPLLDATVTDVVAVEQEMHYIPNPYIDYNGAGLLYFAAYPSIAEHLERLAIGGRLKACNGNDWALCASTLARDIFYFGNLDLGHEIDASVLRLHVLKASDGAPYASLRTVLVEAKTRRRLAEVHSIKTLGV